VFGIGDRVVISESYHWAKGATATIAEPPEFLQNLASPENPYRDGEWFRSVKGRHRNMVFYYVEFDEPQFDADVDGPYKGGEIEETMIIRLI
jgi:hypothetical protein